LEESVVIIIIDDRIIVIIDNGQHSIDLFANAVDLLLKGIKIVSAGLESS